MKRSLCFLILMFVGSVNAAIINDFTGPYSASNWNLTTTGDFTVDNSNSAFLEFEVTNSGSIDSTLTYETVATETGIVSFDWITGGFLPLGPFPLQYTFGTVVDGVLDMLQSDDADLLMGTNGHVDLAVTAGQTFGFQFFAFNVVPGQTFGTTISEFSAPARVSEPSILLLTSVGLLSLISFRRRQYKF